MSNIYHALTTLKLEFQLRGKNITLTPEDLYRRHIKRQIDETIPSEFVPIEASTLIFILE